MSLLSDYYNVDLILFILIFVAIKLEEQKYLKYGLLIWLSTLSNGNLIHMMGLAVLINQF